MLLFRRHTHIAAWGEAPVVLFDFIDADQLTPDRLQHLLQQAVDDLDVEQARWEVAPFIVDQRALDVWSRDFFRRIIPRIVSI